MNKGPSGRNCKIKKYAIAKVRKNGSFKMKRKAWTGRYNVEAGEEMGRKGDMPEPGRMLVFASKNELLELVDVVGSHIARSRVGISGQSTFIGAKM